MKTDPINFISKKNIVLDKKFYVISGNEFTLMDKIKKLILDFYKKDKSFISEQIKSVDEVTKEMGLFYKNKIFVLDDLSKVNINSLEIFSKTEDIFILIEENSTKNKSNKNVFLKRNDAYVFDCYELSKDQKSIIIKNWLNDNKIKLDGDIFWPILEKTDNKYGFLIKELDKLIAINDKKINVNDIEMVLSRGVTNNGGIFFKILRKNRELVDIYNKKITNLNEFNDFFYSTKQFCFLIINSADETSFVKSIPRYLFRERDFLIRIFRKYNSEKKSNLVKLLAQTEKIIRKNNNISQILGLRFLLSLKKLTVS